MAGRTRIEKADVKVARTANPLAGTVVVRALGWASELADQPQMKALCAATVAAGVTTGNRRLARTGAAMLAAQLLATRLKSFVKHRVDRTRPHVLANGGDYRFEEGHRNASAMNSFPSGHTAGAVAVAAMFARHYPEYRAPAYLAAGAVALIQVPRAKHYPTDLAAGAAIGLVSAALLAGVGFAPDNKPE